MREFEKLTTDQALVWNWIKRARGQAKAVTRERLMKVTMLSDRSVRNTIQALRKKGYAIASSSHSTGYYIPSTDAELEQMLKETQSRIKQLAILEKNITMWMYGGRETK